MSSCFTFGLETGVDLRDFKSSRVAGEVLIYQPSLAISFDIIRSFSSPRRDSSSWGLYTSVTDELPLRCDRLGEVGDEGSCSGGEDERPEMPESDLKEDMGSMYV